MKKKFNHVTQWIFDLDNTLYPAHIDLFPQVDKRMGLYISGLLACDIEHARKIQKEYFKNYGATLHGLVKNHNIDPKAFLKFVHDIDLSVLQPNPSLNHAIKKLNGKKFIHTNGSRQHAKRVLHKLGIDNHFHAIFDIMDSKLIPKPNTKAYQSFFKKHTIKPNEAVMFEDLEHNLKIPHQCGMKTVLIQNTMQKQNTLQEYIHHKTDNLTQFLENIVNS